MIDEQYQRTLDFLEKRARFYDQRAKVFKRLVAAPMVITLLLTIYMTLSIYLSLRPGGSSLTELPLWLVTAMFILGPGALVTITLLDMSLVPILARRMLQEAAHPDPETPSIN